MQARVKSLRTPTAVLNPLRYSAAASAADDRLALNQRITRLDSEARLAAEQGDVTASARSILELLDCERRAGQSGPQVLQLIKPRS